MAQKNDPVSKLTFVERCAAHNILFMFGKRRYQELTWYMHNINAGYIWFNVKADQPLMMSYPACRNRSSMH